MLAEFFHHSASVDCIYAVHYEVSDCSDDYYGNDEVKHCEDDAEDFVAICKVVVDKFFHCFVSLSFGRFLSPSLCIHYTIEGVVCQGV